MVKNIDDVKQFWEKNPLWTGESQHPSGTQAFFDEHRQVVIDDCLAGYLDPRQMPAIGNRQNVLDLGCGPGMWTIELSLAGKAENITAADITENALKLVKIRCTIYGVNAVFSQQNAETLTFSNAMFTHVNCQGVIHHTPDTEACVREIGRVLQPNGTALISVYYKNVFISAWPILRWPAKLLYRMGAKLSGRGRETIFNEVNTDEIVRLYDGLDNPIGKAYSKQQFISLLSPYFEIEEIFLHFFPARSLPFSIPLTLHRWLDKHFGFMIFARLTKKLD